MFTFDEFFGGGMGLKETVYVLPLSITLSHVGNYITPVVKSVTICIGGMNSTTVSIIDSQAFIPYIQLEELLVTYFFSPARICE